MTEGLRATTFQLVRYLAPVGLKQSPLRRFCEDGFLGFRAKTAIPGLIEATPANEALRGSASQLVRKVCLEAGAGSLAELRPLTFGLQLNGAFGRAQVADCDAHVLELLPRCAGLATAFALGRQPVAVAGVFDHLPARGTVLAAFVGYSSFVLVGKGRAHVTRCHCVLLAEGNSDSVVTGSVWTNFTQVWRPDLLRLWQNV